MNCFTVQEQRKEIKMDNDVYYLGSEVCATGDHVVNTDHGMVKVKNLNRYKSIKIMDPVSGTYNKVRKTTKTK